MNLRNHFTSLKLLTFWFNLTWTVIFIVAFFLGIRAQSELVMQSAIKEAEASFNKDLAYRRWAAQHGGVYVFSSQSTPPNPHLKFYPLRDIPLDDGRVLTLVNPAYMTRQVYELSKNQYGVRGHITSLNPIRPGNEPDKWEEHILQNAVDDHLRHSDIIDINGSPHLRYMNLLVTEEGCLKCHAIQGYQSGDIRGAISISVPLRPYLQIISNFKWKYGLTLFPIWFIGIFLFNAGTRIHNRQLELNDQAQKELQLHSTLLSRSQAIAHLGSWHYDRKKDILTWSKEVYRIFGVSYQTYSPTYTGFLELVHPDDRELVVHRYEHAVRNKIPYECLHRIIRPDGEIRHVLEKAEPSWDDDQIHQAFGYVHDITDQVHARNALALSEERYHAIFEHAGDYILLLEQRENDLPIIVDANQAALEKHGYTADELIGKPLSIIEPDPFLTPGFHSAVELFQNGHATFETDHFRKDGTSFPVEVTAKLFTCPLGQQKLIISIERDITSRREADRKLRELEERFRLAFQTSPDALAITDINGVFLDINEGFESLTQYTKNEVLGQTSADLNLWYDTAEREKLFATAYEKKIVRNFETKLTTKDGTIKETLISVVILHFQGEDHILSITRDISDIKKTEQEKHDLEKQLLQAQKMESLGRLTGGVAHDFNNILGIIIGYTEMAMDGVPHDSPLHQDLQAIFDAAQRSTEIVRQLLAFSRQQPTNPVLLDLNGVINQALGMLKPLLGEQVELVWEPKPTQFQIVMDPAQIYQILANLCVNAKDALSSGGTIIIELNDVHIEEDQCGSDLDCYPGDFVQIAVQDNGCGIAEDHLDSIFEPFFTTKEVGRGTGLGLATVYGIVKQNKGFVTVDSSPDRGTSFYIHLPSCTTDTHSLQFQSSAEFKTGNGELILLVEDELPVLRMTQAMLEKINYKVLAANSPEKALEKVQNGAEPIALLLTDVIMPEMNGKELSQQLQKTYPALKILYMSGYTFDVHAQREIIREGDALIEKPFTKEQLAVKIYEILQS